MVSATIVPWRGARAEASLLGRLAWPAVLTNLGAVAMGTVDTAMAGRLGAESLAAVALGHLWSVAVGIVAYGASRALDPVVAQAHGAGDRQAVGRGLVHGLIMGALLAVPIMALLASAGPGLRWLGQPPDLAPAAAGYARILVLGVPALIGFMVLRQFLQAMGQMRPATAAILVANVVNAALDWILMFGHLGAPRLGVAGCAVATVVAQWVMLGVLVGLTRSTILSYWPRGARTIAWAPVARMLRLGVPLGLQFGLEVWAFHAAGLMIGQLGGVPLAAHAIAINLATLSFMIPSGIAAAGATRVGNLVGAGLPWRAPAWVAVAMGASCMTVPAACFVALPAVLVMPYTADPEVVALAVVLVPLAGAFQLFDGTQVVCFGVLRGAGDVTVPAAANVLGYWLIGLPAGWWLAFRQDLGPAGIWIGLTIALAGVAGFLAVRVARITT